MKEHPLNPFSPVLCFKSSDTISMAANTQPISVLKNPETYPDTGTGQPWVLILLARWTGMFSPIPGLEHGPWDSVRLLQGVKVHQQPE